MNDVGFKDRKAGLVFFGLLQIALGGILGIMALFQVLITAIPSEAFEEAGVASPGGIAFSAFAIFAPMAVLLVWLGVGSIMARRWARAICLVMGWTGLVFGVVGLLGLFISFPSFSETMSEVATDSSLSGEQMAGMETVMKTGMIIFHLIFYVVVPGVMILFFRSNDVKATCEARDPKTRWTDQCPLPVLALFLLLVAGGFQCVVAGISPFRMFPLFGTLIRGMPAGVLLVAVGAFLVFLARGLYRLNPTAWGATMVFSIIGLASAALTTVRMDPMEMFAGMGLPAEQLEAMATAMPSGTLMILYVVIWGAAWLGYLWWVKRYFSALEVHGPGTAA